MKRGAVVAAAVLTALLISVFASGGPITNGGGIVRVFHGSAFYGLGTPNTPLDLRHDCSSGSGLGWDGSNWNCVAAGGFTIAGSGVSASGTTINVGATTGGMIAIAADTIGLDGTGCSTSWVPTWTGTAFTCQAQSGGGGGSAGYGSGLGSGTIAVAFTTMAASVDLSTLGTIDWEWQGFLTIGTGAQACAVAGSTCHMKLAGGGVLANLGVYAIDSGASTSFPTPAFGLSSDATDDVTKNALATSTTSDGVTKSTSGYGLKFPLPSPGGNIQRVARIYVFADSNTVTCTAHPLDSSATDGTATNTLGAASTGTYELKVTYTTNTATIVSVQCIATSVANTTSKFAWLGTSLGPT